MNLVVLYFQGPMQKFRLKMNPDFYFRPASFIFLIITQYSPKHFLLVLKNSNEGPIITLVMAMASILFLSVLAIAVLLVVLVMLVMLLVI